MEGWKGQMLVTGILLLAAIAVGVWYPSAAPAPQLASAPAQVQVQFGVADQVEAVRGSVVHVLKEGVCEGSGCVISADGIVFAAKHVTDGKPGSYVVTTDDGKKYKVKSVVEDREHDVAFLKLDLPAGSKLSPARLADLSAMRVGDPLFIMGSPLGFDNFNSVSLGILSARQRDIDATTPGGYGYGWRVTFQSDATAEPGNSGGPVFNLDGEVIGVLVAGVDSTVNYSVPVAVFADDVDTVRAWFELSRFQVVPDKPKGESWIENASGSRHSWE